MLTGVLQELSRLQVLSAYTGVGFTTKESEHIVEHPVRRRILILMMVVGNVGFVTQASTLILSFVGVSTRGESLEPALLLLAGLFSLGLIARSRWIERHMLRLMRLALSRRTDLEAYDLMGLLELSGSYGIRTTIVAPEDWW